MILFSAYELSDVLRTHNENMIAEIDSMDGNRLLTTDIDELCRYFEEKYSLSVPILQENITLSPRETSRLLSSSNPSIRFSAARGLIQFDDPSVRTALKRHLESETDSEVRSLIESAGIKATGLP
jgi:HEAT repeat protein